MNTTPNNPGSIDHPGSDHPGSDREALSALFDGELGGDAARFALKRLDHDQAWRDTCERWQRIGDALRGQGALLPAAFPSRVHEALRADVAVAAMANARGASRWRPRWGSVGLAASAALVAFFLARMPMTGGDANDATSAQVATTQSQAPSTQPAQAPSAPDSGLQQATAAAAAVVAARPAAERLAQRSRNVQRGRAATDRVVNTAIASNALAADTRSTDSPITGEVAQPVALVIDSAGVAVPSEAPPSTPPFVPEQTRPWPRAVLPQLGANGANGALAADYATAQQPSFYPFTPRQSLQPADAGATDADTPPQP